MSHFAVLIIGDGIEEKLEPYDENREVEPYSVKLDSKELNSMRNYYTEKGFIIKDLNDLASHLEAWSGHQCQGIMKHEDGYDTLAYLSTYNPDSKWDWYQIGGRFRGNLIPKKGKEGVLGAPGVFGNDPEAPNGVDQIFFGDVDWEAMNKLDPKKEQEEREFWRKAIKGEAEYQFYNAEYYVEKYGTEDNYIKQLATFSTWAVITEDGKWHEAGEMGWWAMTSATPEDEANFNKTFWDRFLKDLPPDTLLTVVDCHI